MHDLTESIAVLDEPEHRLTAGKNLYDLDLRLEGLPGTVFGGIDIGYEGWTGNQRKLPNYKHHGYDGIRITGWGPGATRIQGREATIMCGLDVGIVEIVDCTIVLGDRFGIKIGKANDDPRHPNNKPPLFRDSKLILRNVHLLTRRLEPGEHFSGTWAVHSSNVDHVWEDVYVNCPHTREHCLYAHGFARHGAVWNRVYIEAIGAEGFKCATRPWEVSWVPKANIVLRDCTFSNWYQPGSHRGGAGVALAGSGTQHIYAYHCVFYGRPNEDLNGSPKDQCWMMSDGLSTIQDAANNRLRYYSYDGTPGGAGAPNGYTLIEECAFQGFGGGNKENIRTGTLYPGYEEMGIPEHPIARSFYMKRCGFWGQGWRTYKSRASIREIEDDQIHISGGNAEGTRLFCESELGFDTTEEGWLYTDVGSGPFSEGATKGN